MGQDIRELFKEERKKQYTMGAGHEDRFEARLNKAIPKNKRAAFSILKVAVSVLLLFSVGLFAYLQLDKNDVINTIVVPKDNSDVTEQGISLGDLSPDLKKVENYYMANINLELSELEISPENKALVDSFMERLAELNEEYNKLNIELNKIGPNDQTITALIKNLQLRLQLLQKLKSKLHELKLTENEEVTTNSV